MNWSIAHIIRGAATAGCAAGSGGRFEIVGPSIVVEDRIENAAAFVRFEFFVVFAGRTGWISNGIAGVETVRDGGDLVFVGLLILCEEAGGCE